MTLTRTHHASFLMMAALLPGCINEHIELYRMTLDVEVVAADSARAPGKLVVHHAWSGQGVVRHPLGPIASYDIPEDGALTITLDYPLEDGQGLVLYAWQDRDEDGALCAPGSQDEPVGLIAFEDLAHERQVRIVLDDLCLGAERLWPAPQAEE